MKQQRILVALAHTDHDAELIRYARMLAEMRIGRQFTFVHVISTAPGSPAIDVSTIEADLHAALEQHFVPSSDQFQIACKVDHGARIDVLLDVATQVRADVILLGHRGSSSGQRSLGRRLAMVAPCSVWMVPEGSPAEITNILAPTDFSQDSADSIQAAVAVANAAKLPQISVIHAYFDAASVRYEENVRDDLRSAQAELTQFLTKIDLQGIHVAERSEEGAWPAHNILRAAEDLSTDLLVMSTRGRSRAAAILLGSVTTQVMVETKVPILVIKHFGAMLGLFQVLRENVSRSYSAQKTN
jgi:SulP family sulfate permease